MRFSGNLKEHQAKADEILEIYNENDSFPYESFNLKNLKTTAMYGVEGVKGGVIVELFDDHAFGIIYFASIEKQFRRLGHLKRLISEIKNDIKIIGVQVNMHDNFDLWRSVGFDKGERMINMCQTLLCLEKEELDTIFAKAGAKQNDGGIPVDQLMKMFADRN